MAGEFERMHSNKKEWSPEHWDTYRKLPWGSRRLIDLYCVFPPYRAFVERFVRREIKKYDEWDKRHEEVSALVKKRIQESRARSNFDKDDE
jgi:hypothetical protein